MPRLIYKGDTISNFGAKLPAPSIERVYIEDGYLNVTVNLYIMTSEDDTDISTLLTRLADISYYIAVVPSRKGETYSELNAGTLNIFSSMYSADFCGTTDFRYAYPYIGEGLTFENYSWNTSHASDDEYWTTETTAFNARTTDNEEGEYPTEEAEYALQVADDHNVEDYWAALRVLDSDTYVNPNGKEGTLTGRPLLNPDGAASYVQLSFDDFGDSVDTVYDSQGNKILVYSYTTDDELHHIAPDDGSDGNGNYYFSAYEEWTNLNVYTFSSFLDWSNDSDNIEDMMTDNVSLLNQNISDVSYEKLFEDGVIAGQAEQMWMDPNGDPFDGTSLQEIMQRYHKPTKITHKQIVARFQDLIERFDKPLKPRRRGRPPLSKLTKKLGGRSFPSPTGSFQLPEDLQDVIDNLNYVLIEYAEEPDLLPRLNELRKAWPNKSSTNRVGKLYNAFKKTLNDANKAVIGEPLLTKQLVLNPKIIDLRVTAQSDWEQREIELNEEAYIPLDAEAYPTEFIYPWWKVSAETIYSSDIDDSDIEYADVMKINGYIWFDMEKYIHRSSLLCNIFDTQKIDSMFGKELINSRCRHLVESELTRVLSNGKEASRIKTEYDQVLYGDGDGPLADTCEATHASNVTGYPNYPSVTTYDGDTLYSYCALRNYNAASAAADNDYRLMMFEFQDLCPAPDEDKLLEYASSGDSLPWTYEFELEFDDKSLQVYAGLVFNYYSYYTGSLSEYYDLSSELCNYNNIDGRFNEFFIDGITSAYEGAPGEVPWIRAPLLFCLHRDLLFNTFNGDWDEIIVETKNISDRIGPYGGTLESLELFVESFKSLYDDYYDTTEGTTPGAFVSPYWTGVGPTDADGETITLTTEFEDFPYYYDGTESTAIAPWYKWSMSSLNSVSLTGNEYTNDEMSDRMYELLAAIWEFLGEPVAGEAGDTLAEFWDDNASTGPWSGNQYTTKLAGTLGLHMYKILYVLDGYASDSSSEYSGVDNVEALYEDIILERVYGRGADAYDDWLYYNNLATDIEESVLDDSQWYDDNNGYPSYSGTEYTELLLKLVMSMHINRYIDANTMVDIVEAADQVLTTETYGFESDQAVTSVYNAIEDIAQTDL